MYYVVVYHMRCWKVSEEVVVAGVVEAAEVAVDLDAVVEVALDAVAVDLDPVLVALDMVVQEDI